MGYINDLLGRNEQIVLITRTHWMFLALTALIDALLTAVALVIGGIVFPPLALLAILPVLHFALRLTDWYNEQFIVTNRRVMEVHGVVNKRVSDSSLEKVNDVVLVQSVMGRLLNYGTVEIITGSDIGVNFFKNIAHPVRFKTEMLNQKEDLSDLDSYGGRARHILAAEPPTRGDIPELIAELDELRKNGIISDDEFQAKKAELLSRM
jgi:uncharacterized membrane protein YdbT with pleckstrin-like domain